MGWSNNTTWSGGDQMMLVKRDSLYIVVPMSILYGGIFVTGLLGNLITCLVISRNRHMHTATNYYLFSLAVSDLLLLVTGLPEEIYSIWSRYPYIWGEVWCVGRGLAAETSANATVLTITAFTVERYIAICHPFLAHTISNLTRAAKSILLIWILAILFAAPQAFQFGVITREYRGVEIAECTQVREIVTHSFEISTFVFFVTPMVIITVLYAMIGFRLRKNHLRDSKPPALCKQHATSQRVLKMLVAVVVAFFICWAPFHVQRLMAIYLTHRIRSRSVVKLFEAVTYLSGILYYVSTTINPILYHIMSYKFRMAFKNFLSCRRRSEGGYAVEEAEPGSASTKSCPGPVQPRTPVLRTISLSNSRNQFQERTNIHQAQAAGGLACPKRRRNVASSVRTTSVTLRLKTSTGLLLETSLSTS